jgi:quinol-cytochrome oxidoreductase complex cytochrome b subunit
MRIMIGKIGQWFDRRLQLAAPIREAVEHPVPRRTASWWYVFGSAALTVFILQIVTGILLALIYVPSAAEAWSSLQALNHGRRSRLVHPRDAWLGVEFHARDCSDSHGAGFSLRSL